MGLSWQNRAEFENKIKRISSVCKKLVMHLDTECQDNLAAVQEMADCQDAGFHLGVTQKKYRGMLGGSCKYQVFICKIALNMNKEVKIIYL